MATAVVGTGNPIASTSTSGDGELLPSASPTWRLVGNPTVSYQIQPSKEPFGERRTDRVFATTHWSVVLVARDDGPEGLQAFDVLCRAYWTTLYAYALRDGLTPQNAVQGLLAQLLARRDLHRVGPERGRFQSFLMAALKNILVSRTPPLGVGPHY